MLPFPKERQVGFPFFFFCYSSLQNLMVRTHYVAKESLELWSCLYLPSTGTIGMQYHTWIIWSWGSNLEHHAY